MARQQVVPSVLQALFPSLHGAALSTCGRESRRPLCVELNVPEVAEIDSYPAPGHALGVYMTIQGFGPRIFLPYNTCVEAHCGNEAALRQISDITLPQTQR